MINSIVKLSLVLSILLIAGCGECEDSMDGGSFNTGIDSSNGLSNIDVDILVVSSGQSNSSGSHQYKFEYTELSNTYFFLDGYWYEDYPYGTTGPEASLVNQLAKEYPFKNIGIIKYAVGGTSLALDWDTDGQLYTTLVETVIDGKTKASVNSIDGFFWMQGEADASNKHMAALYKTNFIEFISSLRDDIGYTPVFTALISEPIKASVEYVDAVRNAQIYVADTLSNVYLIDTYTLIKCCDALHFTIESQKTLGKLFANTFINYS